MPAYLIDPALIRRHPVSPSSINHYVISIHTEHGSTSTADTHTNTRKYSPRNAQRLVDYLHTQKHLSHLMPIKHPKTHIFRMQICALHQRTLVQQPSRDAQSLYVDYVYM